MKELEQTMTVKEVSEILGVSERYIQEKVKEYFPEIVRNGIQTKLSQMQITQIKMDIEKNPHLAQPFEVKTDMEMAFRLIEAGEYFKSKYEEVKAENAILKPKAESYQKYIESGTLFTMKAVADIINKKGFGQNNLYSFLRENGILCESSSNWNMPYRPFIDAGYFEIKEIFIEAMGTVKKQLYVTQKGIDYISSRIEGIQ